MCVHFCVCLDEQSKPTSRASVVDHVVVSLGRLGQRIRGANERPHAVLLDQRVHVIVHQLKFALCARQTNISIILQFSRTEVHNAGNEHRLLTSSDVNKVTPVMLVSLAIKNRGLI